MPRPSRISEEQWESHRERIQELRLKKMQLRHIIPYMQENDGFFAKEHEYKKKFTEWGLARKNIKDPDLLWAAVDERLKKRKREDKQSQVIIEGREVDPETVNKEISRHFLTTKRRILESAIVDLPQQVVVNTPPPITSPQLSPSSLPRNITFKTLPWIQFDILILPKTISDLFPQIPPATTRTSASLTNDAISLNGNDCPATMSLVSYINNSDTLDIQWEGGLEKDCLSGISTAYFENRLAVLIPERENSQKWLGRLTQSGKVYNDVLPLFSHAVYLVSNDLLDHNKLYVLLNWAIENRLFWVIQKLAQVDLPTVAAFVSQLLCSAIQIGDASVVETLLALGASASSYLSCPCSYRTDPLEHAFGQLRQCSTRTPDDIDKSDRIESIIRALISAGADVNTVRQRPVLQEAVQHGSTDITRIILEAGAEVNAPATERYECIHGVSAPCEDIRTPFQMAYALGRTEIIQLLIEYGADTHACVSLPENWTRYENETLLTTAVMKNDFSFAESLLVEGAHPLSPERFSLSCTPLEAAIEGNHVELATLLLKHLAAMANIAISPSPFPELSLYYKIPLKNAVVNSNMELTSLLLKYLSALSSAAGSQSMPEELSSLIWFLLAQVVGKDDVELVGLLLSFILVLPITQEKERKTDLLTCAISSNSLNTLNLFTRGFRWTLSLGDIIKIYDTSPHLKTEVVEHALRWALKAGTDINEANEDGITLLLAACYAGNAKLIEVLLSLGADISAPNERYPCYCSPFSAAIASKSTNKEVLEVLVAAGAPFTDEALFLASREGSTMLVNSVLSIGVDPNSLIHPLRRYPTWDECYRESGSTSLHVASWHSREIVVECLLKAGADPNFALGCGCTPLGLVLKRLPFITTPIANDKIEEALPGVPAQTQLLKTLLEHGANPNQPFHTRHYKECDTPSRRQVQCFRRSYGENLFDTRSALVTPLTYLATYKCTKAVETARLLLTYGALPRLKEGLLGPSPLQLSAAFGDTEMMEFLLHNLEDENRGRHSRASEAYRGNSSFPSAVEAAILIGSTEKLQILEASCGPLNLSRKSYWLTLGLRKAVVDTNVMLVKKLIHSGVDPSGEEPGYQELRHVLNTFRYYLSSSTYAFGYRERGFTLLQLLGESISESFKDDRDLREDNELAIAESLLDAGVDVNQAAARSRTPLARALEKDHDKLARLYLSRGANVNPTRELRPSWKSPLQTAAKRSNTEMVERLLEKGADVNAAPSYRAGGTALQFAAIRGNIQIALLLLEKGANINAPGSAKNGRTALEGAAEYGRLDMIHLLLENSELDERKSIKEQCITAANFAEGEGHLIVSKALREWEAKN